MAGTKKQIFIPEVCRVKHEAIDKEITIIKEGARELKEGKAKEHDEIKGLIKDLSEKIDRNCDNLKNKIVLSEKKTGDKIDALARYDDELRGNGDPGIWEYARFLNAKFWLHTTLIIVILIISLGGNWKGITFKSIKEKFGWENEQETVQIEENIIIEETTKKEKGN